MNSNYSVGWDIESLGFIWKMYGISTEFVVYVLASIAFLWLVWDMNHAGVQEDIR
jgi:uncharacterized membrane protein YecN with MAPEG domain